MGELTVRQLQEYCIENARFVSVSADGAIIDSKYGYPSISDRHNLETITETILGAQYDPDQEYCDCDGCTDGCTDGDDCPEDRVDQIRQNGNDGLHYGVNKTLAERGNRYGDFAGHAQITQQIKRAMAEGRNWSTLPDDMKEALEMIAHKIGRILNGDPEYIDSWHDIIGYARLVEKRLEDEQTNG